MSAVEKIRLLVLNLLLHSEWYNCQDTVVCYERRQMDKEAQRRATGVCQDADIKHSITKTSQTRFLIIITFGFLVKLYCDGFFSLSSKQSSL